MQVKAYFAENGVCLRDRGSSPPAQLTDDIRFARLVDDLGLAVHQQRIERFQLLLREAVEQKSRLAQDAGADVGFRRKSFGCRSYAYHASKLLALNCAKGV